MENKDFDMQCGAVIMESPIKISVVDGRINIKCGKNTISLWNHTIHDIEQVKMAIDAAYKQGFSDASIMLMNK